MSINHEPPLANRVYPLKALVLSQYRSSVLEAPGALPTPAGNPVEEVEGDAAEVAAGGAAVAGALVTAGALAAGVAAGAAEVGAAGLAAVVEDAAACVVA